MQLPRPNTYIKIKDIEQLKLLCEYKNDKVRPDEEFDLNENIKNFEDWYIYFKWNNYWDWYNTNKYGIDGTYTKLTDDSFLYPNKKPMDKFIITGINDSNREEVRQKLEKDYKVYAAYMEYIKEMSIFLNNGKYDYTWIGEDGYYEKKYKNLTFITASEFLWTKSPKPKKEKQEVFINKFYPWEKVWFYHNDKIFSEIIDSVCKYERPYCFNVNWNMVFLKESEMFKTKSQLIKSLSKQWRQEVEDRILSLTK